MENLLFLLPFLFISMIAIIVLVVVAGAIIFTKLNKVLSDIKLLKDELSYNSENALEETVSIESLKGEIERLENQMNMAFKNSQNDVEKKVESKILEMRVNKKELKDERWAGFKEAFKLPSAQEIK